MWFRHYRIYYAICQEFITQGGDIVSTVVRENVKRICRESGRTISSVESNVGISKGYIYNMVNPTYNLMKSIADELGVDVCDLITERVE